MVNDLKLGRCFTAVISGLLLLAASDMLYADVERIQRLTAEGNYGEALELANRELAADQSNVSYRFLKGLILTRMDRLEEARDIFVNITTTNPELPEPYNNLAVIYASLGDYDKARQLLEEAINTHPAYATAHENIGDIYAKLASQAYNQALELDSENNSARAKLSLVNDLFSLPEPPAGSGMAPVDNTAQTGEVPVEEPQPAVIASAEQDRKPAETAAASEAEIDAREQELIRQNRELERQISISRIKETVLDWALAWSNQDVDSYLAYYADDFSPEDGRTLGQWRNYRRERVSAPGRIQVEVSDLAVELLGDEHARAVFTQVYQSPTYGDRVKKTLLMKLEGDQWRITQEDT